MAVDSSDANGTDGLPEAVIDDLLSDSRREVMLRSLREHDKPIPVMQLAANVIARERSMDADNLSRSECRRVAVNLYEHHIPKLTATAVVRYNSRQASIVLDDTASQLSNRLFDDVDRNG